MKIDVKECFNPIKLEITIETEQELCTLWHRMNVRDGYFHETDYTSGDDLRFMDDGKVPLWTKLDELVKKCNLKVDHIK